MLVIVSATKSFASVKVRLILTAQQEAETEDDVSRIGSYDVGVTSVVDLKLVSSESSNANESAPRTSSAHLI